MADNTNLEVSDRRLQAPHTTFRRLVYHSCFGPVAQGKLVESFALQNYKARSELKRTQGPSILLQVLVKIGSGQYHNDRRDRVMISEPPNRIGALESVERNQEIAAFTVVTTLDIDLMTQCFQYPGIAKRRNLVAVPDI